MRILTHLIILYIQIIVIYLIHHHLLIYLTQNSDRQLIYTFKFYLKY